MRASAARTYANTTTASIVVGVVSLAVILGVLAGLAMKAAESLDRQPTPSRGPALTGRPAEAWPGWSSVKEPGGPVEPGPMRLQIVCEQCPPAAPNDL